MLFFRLLCAINKRLVLGRAIRNVPVPYQGEGGLPSPVFNTNFINIQHALIKEKTVEAILMYCIFKGPIFSAESDYLHIKNRAKIDFFLSPY